MKHILILGAGRFGRLACERLSNGMKEAVIGIGDKDDKKAASMNIPWYTGDAVDILDTWVKEHGKTGWIIPAVPFHLGFFWLKKKLSWNYRFQIVPVPAEVIKALPNPFTGKDGEIYISNADFICPDNCPEPADICTCTGKPRPGIMYQRLRQIAYPPFHALVIRSRQILPGVGGYPVEDLFHAKKEILDACQKGRTCFFFGTACKCHGVLHGFTMDGDAF